MTPLISGDVDCQTLLMLNMDILTSTKPVKFSQELYVGINVKKTVVL